MEKKEKSKFLRAQCVVLCGRWVCLWSPLPGSGVSNQGSVDVNPQLVAVGRIWLKFSSGEVQSLSLCGFIKCSLELRYDISLFLFCLMVASSHQFLSNETGRWRFYLGVRVRKWRVEVVFAEKKLLLFVVFDSILLIVRDSCGRHLNVVCLRWKGAQEGMTKVPSPSVTSYLT